MAFYFGLIDTHIYENLVTYCYGDEEDPLINCTDWLNEYDQSLTNIDPQDVLSKCYYNTQPKRKLGGPMKYQFTQNKAYNHLYDSGFHKRLREVPPCSGEEVLVDYLNHELVKK